MVYGFRSCIDRIKFYVFEHFADLTGLPIDVDIDWSHDCAVWLKLPG